MNTQPLPVPKPVLKPGVIYSVDNGSLVCAKCAGQSALYTGYDISGLKAMRLNRTTDAAEWFRLMGRALSCEGGCTVYPLPPTTNTPMR